MTTKERLLKAIAPLGRTDEERAARLGITTRALGYWKAGEGLKAIMRLEAAGIIRIIEPSDEKPADIAA